MLEFTKHSSEQQTEKTLIRLFLRTASGEAVWSGSAPFVWGLFDRQLVFEILEMINVQYVIGGPQLAKYYPFTKYCKTYLKRSLKKKTKNWFSRQIIA